MRLRQRRLSDETEAPLACALVATTTPFVKLVSITASDDDYHTKIVGDCAAMTFGQEPATTNCIKAGAMLSDACTACFSMTIACTVQKCIQMCIAGANSPGCVACRNTNCQPAFVKCSGIIP